MSDAWLELLDHEECLALLGAGVVGRIAFVRDDVPVVFPINYRLVEQRGQTRGSWIAVRTRPGNVIETAPFAVAFEIDDFESNKQGGWSVLVQGDLYRIDSDVAEIRTRFDSDPWLTDERDAWLLIQPFSISGRRLHGETPEWVFHSAADP